MSDRASDWPSSRPPSSRWTTTLTRGGRWRASSGRWSVSVLTSLIALPRRMLTPGYRPSAFLRLGVASTETLRGPAAVEHPLRPGHALGDTFDLRGARGHRGGAAVAARLRDHDSDRHRHERRAQHAAAALFGLDPAPVAVDRVVESRDRLVESLGDLGGDHLRHARLGQDHEVVAADVAREVLSGVVLFQDLEDDRRQRLDDVVAAQEAVVVVVALEGIDVGVEHREALALSQAPADLAEDVAVAAHAGERAQPPRGRGARHHRPQPGHELFGHEWFGHVVVGAREQVLDFVLE